ncbi:MAG: hypothetical protein ACO3RV_00040 [Luteolibacter sp.]
MKFIVDKWIKRASSLAIGCPQLYAGMTLACFMLLQPASAEPKQASAQRDAELVKSLLRENLSQRTFDFSTVVEACSGMPVIPLNESPAHKRVIAAVEAALAETIRELNQADSPVRSLRRINEASRFFEDGLMRRLNAMPNISCEIPVTRHGQRQRSGYPDLRLVDEETSQVFYLDPKLVEQSSFSSTLRTFYFEPKDETLKIIDPAVHLLIGISHDGKVGKWTFGDWKLSDLSHLKVRLKAEFQASNAELYRDQNEARAMEGSAQD